MISCSNTFNENYACKVITITEGLRKHSNADRLLIATIDGLNCIVGTNTKLNDSFVFVPTECKLNPEFLKVNNLYENKELNDDSTKKGYINKHGRVRAITLRGESSSAFLLEISSIENWLGKKFEYENGKLFDTIDDKLFCSKYVPLKLVSVTTSKTNKKIKGYDRVIDNQFRFHIDTTKLVNNLDKFKLDDLIHISSKVHGTSWICSNVIVSRKPSILNYLFKLLHIKQEDVYDNLYASRSVIKNRYNQYCKLDIWKHINNDIKHLLVKGLTVYGEACGYLPETATYIQKPFDYGASEGTYKLYIYRVTYTNPQGFVFEFSAKQVQQWCEYYGLNPVTELYYGTIRQMLDKYNIDHNDPNWKKLWFNKLSTDFYMEQDDPECRNKVPFEGLVIRKEKLHIESYKLKSIAFLEKETKELDTEIINIEDEN
jgi:hypothetical protein